MFTPTYLNSTAFNNSGYLRMMNDVKRNQFYNNILREVTGKRCLEIGFGHGLLSLIALKYQPKHIVAVETNVDVYEFGKYLIKKLGIENKITLIQEQINASFINLSEFDLVYHEIMNKNMWGEGAFLQFDTAVPMIPSEYTCEFYACEISTDEFLYLNKMPKSYTADAKFVDWYNSVRDLHWPNVNLLDDFDLLPDLVKIECLKNFGFDKGNFVQTTNNKFQKFIPGVDLRIDYINQIQQLIDAYHTCSSDTILNIDLPYYEYPTYLNRSKKIASITVSQPFKTITVTDHNNVTAVTEIDFTKTYMDLIIDRAALTGMSFILPIFSIKHHQSTLILSAGHWGHSPNSVIVTQNANDVMVRQHFNTNGIEYSSS